MKVEFIPKSAILTLDGQDYAIRPSDYLMDALCQVIKHIHCFSPIETLSEGVSIEITSPKVSIELSTATGKSVFGMALTAQQFTDLQVAICREYSLSPSDYQNGFLLDMFSPVQHHNARVG